MRMYTNIKYLIHSNWSKGIQCRANFHWQTEPNYVAIGGLFWSGPAQATLCLWCIWYMHHRAPEIPDAFNVHAPAACSSITTWAWIFLSPNDPYPCPSELPAVMKTWPIELPDCIIRHFYASHHRVFLNIQIQNNPLLKQKLYNFPTNTLKRIYPPSLPLWVPLWSARLTPSF